MAHATRLVVLDGDHELGFVEFGLETSIFSTEASDFFLLGVTRLGWPTRGGLLLAGQGAAVTLLTPFGDVRGVGADATKQLAPARVATRVGLILSNNREFLGRGPGSLIPITLDYAALA
jgi:hypothetical protein